MTDCLLLQADQKLFIINILNILSIVVNLLVCVTLLEMEVGIHIVKLASMLVFLLQPMGIHYYVRKKYSLNQQMPHNPGLLKQRWDGLLHHVAYFIHRNTDIAVLTFFSSYKEISVYAVYNLVVSNIQIIISMLGSSVIAKFGEMNAKGNREGEGRGLFPAAAVLPRRGSDGGAAGGPGYAGAGAAQRG